MPLDLHVLSLSLAFILSQDQTLHSKNSIFCLFLSRRRICCPEYFPGIALAACFKPYQYLKELMLPSTPPSFLPPCALSVNRSSIFSGESGCKDKGFYPFPPNLSAYFFKLFSELLKDRLIPRSLSLPLSYSCSSFPARPFSSIPHRRGAPFRKRVQR